MKKLRLLHLVFLATGALLVFKSIGIFTQSGFVLSPVLEAQAQGGGSCACGRYCGTRRWNAG